MACSAELFLDAGQALRIDVDQCNVPAVLGQCPGGDSADPRRTTGSGDNGGA
jgi:hypothetical protein